MAEQVTTTERFQQILEKHEKVIVDFSAIWCRPCLMIGPVFERLAENHEKELYFVKVDVDEASDIAEMYQITALPTIKSFVNGKAISKFDMRGGDKAKLTKLVQELIKFE